MFQYLHSIGPERLLWCAAESTYVKVHCEGDRTRPLFATGKGEAEDSAVFDSTPLMFVVIHSYATVLIKARDKKEGALFYGQVLLDYPNLCRLTAVVRRQFRWHHHYPPYDSTQWCGRTMHVNNASRHVHWHVSGVLLGICTTDNVGCCTD